MMIPILLLVAGITSVTFAARISRSVQVRYDRRISELENGADEVYFEEQRALNAYPQRTTAWRWRLLGAGLIVTALIEAWGGR